MYKLSLLVKEKVGSEPGIYRLNLSKWSCQDKKLQSETANQTLLRHINYGAIAQR